MKELPLGKQNFEEIINGNFLYVDKTEKIYKILQKGNLYFLARPRRFGKSVLLSTFQHLFLGKKDLFKNLYIGQSTNYSFESYPTLHFNFAAFGYQMEDWEAALNAEMERYALKFEVLTDKKTLGTQLRTLIRGISEKNKPVVLLIDEYDKPIIDFFTDIPKAKANRKILRDFFSPLKDLEAQGHLRFLLISGVSKFSKISLFSDLNNLKDLSQSNWANDLLGVTQTELERDFASYIEEAERVLSQDRTQLLTSIKEWYNGYSYDGKVKVCNPFSLLSFFGENKFGNYWFTTGTPNFLVEAIRKQGIKPKELENIVVDEFFFDFFSIEHLDIIGLLYQTGYLTIQKIITKNNRRQYYLAYPNLEVRYSMIYNLAQAFTYKKQSVVSQAMVRMQDALEGGNVAAFIQQLKIILSDISYQLHPRKIGKNETEAEAIFKMWEGYFQTIIYLVTSYMDLSVQSEVAKHKGRLDLIAEAEQFIYIMEFKLDENSTDAVTQIKSREYAAAYQNSLKTIFLVGVNFSKEERNVEDWECIEWKR